MNHGMRVGTLAERTGVSVRTLHYYDEIGLLKPSGRTEAGHRLYNDKDVARLQQIVSLKDLGLSLEEITECLSNPEFSPLAIVRMHSTRLNKKLKHMQKLYERLRTLEQHLQGTDDVTTDEFIHIIESITMIEKYFDEETLEQLQQRRESFGKEAIKNTEKQWEVLAQKVSAEMNKGTDPTSEPVQELAREWTGLLELFTGGNPQIESSVREMYKTEGIEKASRGLFNAEMFEYMGKAITYLNQNS